MVMSAALWLQEFARAGDGPYRTGVQEILRAWMAEDFEGALAAVRALSVKPLNFFIIVFVDVFRSLPPLAIILVLFFGAPAIGIVLPSLVVLWLSLGAVLAAFAEEIFWGGITSVHKGQWLAARSTGSSSPARS